MFLDEHLDDQFFELREHHHHKSHTTRTPQTYNSYILLDLQPGHPLDDPSIPSFGDLTCQLPPDLQNAPALFADPSMIEL